MSDSAVLRREAVVETSNRVPTVPVLGVALVSFAALLLELSLTRLFSVVLFYHFAFLSISIALLGLGAGGVFAFIFQRRLARYSTRTIGAVLCALNALAIFAALEVVLHILISLQLSSYNFKRLTAIYLSAAVPFFFSGLLFSVVFAREPRRIPQLYGADLLGGAVACLAVVPLLNWIGGPNAILFAGIAMALASAIWALSARSRTPGILLAAMLLVLIAANHSGRLIAVIYAKVIRITDYVNVEYVRWNAISRIDLATK